jgi:hypothetical protein
MLIKMEKDLSLLNHKNKLSILFIVKLSNLKEDCLKIFDKRLEINKTKKFI